MSQPTVIICLSVQLFASNLCAAAPANDRFANRITLAGTNAVVTGSNVGASKEAGEPNHAGNPGGRSVWWSWSAPASGEVEITTDNSALDTLLGVYTGTRVSALSPVAANDDHGVLVTSRVRFEVAPGTDYEIAVDGFNDGTTTDAGDVVLALTFRAGPVVRPANDNFASGMLLSGLLVETNAHNIDATRESGESLHAGTFGDRSVWWSWRAPESGPVIISTEGSEFDTLLGIYLGDSVLNLVEMASSDDIDPMMGVLTSRAVFEARAGDLYRIAVDGFDGASGPIQLRVGLSSTRLSAPVRLTDGSFRFTITGLPGNAYTVEAAADLETWSPIGAITNTTGSVVFIDSEARDFPERLYRLLLR